MGLLKWLDQVFRDRYVPRAEYESDKRLVAARLAETEGRLALLEAEAEVYARHPGFQRELAGTGVVASD